MRTAVARAVLGLALALASVALAVSQWGFPAVAAAIGVRVGVPGAAVELTRALAPVVVALLVAALCLRFAVRALRSKATLFADLSRGGKLLAATAWAAWLWLVVELSYRQFWLGWATTFGEVGTALACSAGVAALCVLAERRIPWSRAPLGVRRLGVSVVLVLASFTASSAWMHRHVVPGVALIPVAVVGLGLVASGVLRVETGPKARMLVELALASTLLAGPFWSLLE